MLAAAVGSETFLFVTGPWRFRHGPFRILRSWQTITTTSRSLPCAPRRRPICRPAPHPTSRRCDRHPLKPLARTTRPRPTRPSDLPTHPRSRPTRPCPTHPFNLLSRPRLPRPPTRFRVPRPPICPRRAPHTPSPPTRPRTPRRRVCRLLRARRPARARLPERRRLVRSRRAHPRARSAPPPPSQTQAARIHALLDARYHAHVGRSRGGVRYREHAGVAVLRRILAHVRGRLHDRRFLAAPLA